MKRARKKKRPTLQAIYGKKRGDKLEKCVLKVKKNSRKYGRNVNPYAVCQSQYHFKKRKRKRG
jgi:hypothetical protein